VLAVLAVLVLQVQVVAVVQVQILTQLGHLQHHLA
jgi:hypothetical protein